MLLPDIRASPSPFPGSLWELQDCGKQRAPRMDCIVS